MTVIIRVDVLDRLCHERGLPGEGLKVSPTTRARIRKGLPVRESTAKKLAESLRGIQPDPLLAELVA